MTFKKILITFFIVLILFGVVIRFVSLDKDLSAEETDFINPAISLKETGKSIYYLSEQQPNQIGLLHPPMYILVLSKVVNQSLDEFSVRIVNIIFSILTALLIFLFCINFVNSRRKMLIGLAAAALFLINYFILSSSIMLDIDTLSMFFMFAFIFFILMDHKTMNHWYFILSAISLFFGISNRYPIAFLVYVAIGVYFIANKELRKSFTRYLAVGVIAGISFVAIWWIYSTFFEPGNFLTFIAHNAALGSENLSNIGVYLGSFMLNISQFIRLFTLPFTILMILSFFYFAKRKDKSIRMLLIYALSILLLFIIIPRPAFGYPRYFLTLFPAVIILISLFVYENLEISKIGKRLALVAVISFVLSLLLLLIFHPQSTFYESNGLIKATNLPDFTFNLLASFPLFFVFFFKDKRKSAAILILLALVLSYSLYFDLAFVAHDSHIKETGIYIKEHTTNEDVIISPKAVGYYTERKFYTNDFTKPSMNFSLSFLSEYFKLSIRNREMDNQFFWEEGYFGGINPPKPSQDILDKTAYVVLYHPVGDIAPEKKIGNFYIYRIK